MKDYTEELGIFLEEYINARSFSFLREDPCAFASRLSEIFSVFYFPSIEEEAMIEGLKVKALYSLWNIVIDDIVEYSDKGKENIFESLEALTRFKNGDNFIAKTEAGQIVYDSIQRFYNLSLGPNRKISEELIFLDLTRIINGFDYERITHESDMLSTFSEYIEFGVPTIDGRIILDIDIALYPYSLSLFTIGDLREAYKWFGLAFKLSSDIATFEREYFVEASHNAVILYGQKKGLLPRDVLKAKEVVKEKLFEDVIPSLMNEIKEKGKEYLFKSLECLDNISEVDTSPISTAFKSMFKIYPGKKNFQYCVGTAP